MRFRNVSIESLACELAPERVSSAAIEARMNGAMKTMKLPPRPIEGLTGIQERGWWPASASVGDAATSAARKAIAEAGIQPGQIGLLVNTSVSKEFLEPSMASIVHGNLGLSPSCRNFDIANACLGFLNGMEIAGQMIDAGMIDYALVVDAENSRPVVESTLRRLSEPGATAQDFWDNFATLTLGSTAVAMVLGRADRSRTTHRLNGSVSLAATEFNRLCMGTNERMITDSAKLLRAGVDLARKTWKVAEDELVGWSEPTIDQYICHQVGKAHLQALCTSLAIPQARCFLSYPTFGNVGPAAVPLTLLLAQEAEVVRPGNHVALMGIGSGLNVAMMSLTW